MSCCWSCYTIACSVKTRHDDQGQMLGEAERDDSLGVLHDHGVHRCPGTQRFSDIDVHVMPTFEQLRFLGKRCLKRTILHHVFSPFLEPPPSLSLSLSLHAEGRGRSMERKRGRNNCSSGGEKNDKFEHNMTHASISRNAVKI